MGLRCRRGPPGGKAKLAPLVDCAEPGAFSAPMSNEPEEALMETITRIQEAIVDLADELAHAERLIEEQAARIEALEAENALLRNYLSPAA